jgi:hypothetical protein
MAEERTRTVFPEFEAKYPEGETHKPAARPPGGSFGSVGRGLM